MRDFDFGRRSSFDPLFPNISEKIREPGYDAEFRTLPSRVTGETEMIARTAYRLGHAEQGVDSWAEKCRQLEEKLSEAREARKEAADEAERNQRWYESERETASELRTQVEKLEKQLARLKPKKTIKKGSKK